MGKQFETKEFLRLKREWDAKLAASGFVDVEAVDGLDDGGFHDLNLLHEANIRRRRAEDGTEELYRLADQWVHEHRWRSRRARLHWVAWADGMDLAWVFRTHPATPGQTTYQAFQAAHRKVQDEMIEARAMSGAEGTDDE